MKKNLLLSAILLAISILLPLKSQAYDFSAVAPSGQTLYYNIVDGNAQVTTQNSSQPYYNDANKPTGDLTIPSTVTYNGTTYSVTSIGEYTFLYCGLTSITIPNSVTEIGGHAFTGCSRLTSISSSATSIGEYAFSYCNGLTSVILQNSVTSIGEGSFWNCSSLTSITIPNSVTAIGMAAFAGCNNLTSMVVENGNTVYDSRNNCNAIIETETNTLINSCKNTTIPNSVTSIGIGAFYECNGLTSITIPNSVTSIGESSFYNCIDLTSVNIGSSVTTIGRSAFNNTGLTSITIPNSTTHIGNYAFCNCHGLTSVTIGNSVYSIGEYAFLYCDSIMEIHSLNNVAPTVGSYAFEDVTSTIPIYIPCGSTSSYTSSYGWSYFSNFIEDCGPNGIDDKTSATDNIKIYTRGNTIVIDYSGQQAADSRQSVVVYDIMGRVIKQAADGCQQAAVEIPVTSAGVYMVKVGERPSRKVVVRP